MNAAKVYKTKQRDLIMNCLIKNKENHLTAEDIVDHLKVNGNTVGKTTVYRYLDKLVFEGKLRKYFIEEGYSACYQYVGSEKCYEHFHLKCVGCGSLIHLECSYLQKLQSHVSNSHDFKIDSLKTVFYGRCKNCESDN